MEDTNSQKHMIGMSGSYHDPMVYDYGGGPSYSQDTTVNIHTQGYGYRYNLGQPETPPGFSPNTTNFLASLNTLNSPSKSLVFPSSFEEFNGMGNQSGHGMGSQNVEVELSVPYNFEYGNRNTADPMLGTHEGVETPPSSLDYDLNIIPNGVKLELSDALFDPDGLNMSGLSSSQESATGGDRLPVLTSFPGKYSFSVEPVEKCGKKCLIWLGANKIYCSPNLPIRFSFQLDFAKAPLKIMTVEAMMVYTCNEHTMEPVHRCQGCIGKEKKTNGGTTLDPGTENHMLRLAGPRADYKIKENQRHVVSGPVDKPAPGENRFLRNYTFACLNSCRPEKERRLLCVIFYLMEKGKEVGRHCFNVKICKCPTRDCTKDNANMMTGGKRKSSSPAVTPVAGEAGEAPKRRRTTSPLALAQRAQATNIAPAAAPDSSSDEKRNSQETDNEELFSSQDSQMSGNLLQKISGDMKLVYAHRKNPDVVAQQLAELAWAQMKTFRRTVQYMRNHVLKEEQHSLSVRIPIAEPEPDTATLP